MDRLGDHSPVHGFLFRKQIKEVLRESWNVQTKKQLQDAIDSLRITGHREYCYEQELKRYKTTGLDQYHLDKHRYLIWDYCRIIQLYRWGYILGWFLKDWCWEQMLKSSLIIPRGSAAYLRGRELWAGEKLGNTDTFEEAVDWLKTEENSPWQVNWDLELKKDW